MNHRELNIGYLMTSLLAWAWHTQAHALPMMNMHRGVTATSHDIYYLHMLILGVCCVIGVGVFSVMFYAMAKHRRSKGAEPANFHHNFWVEVVWTVIPFLILVALAIPAVQVLMNMHDTGKPDVNIKIVGYQWKWKYEYLDEGISFFSSLSTTQDQIHNKVPKNKWYLLEVDRPLVVPIHKKIRFMITSNDVNHSWWVPDFAIKTDALPGIINTTWTRIDKPGVYRGQCTELCGMHHGYMPIVVIAKTPADYRQWVAEHAPRAAKAAGKQPTSTTYKPPKLSKKQLMTQGQHLFQQQCVACHRSHGEGMPPVFPALAGSPIATGPISGTIDILLHGVKGTAMQAFGEQLNDEDIASVITYVRNSWGNADRNKRGQYAGGIVQPSMIAQQREAS